MDGLERLQGLHADLLAFTETRLANIDRLWQELEDSIEDLRKLLDKPVAVRTETEAYHSGKLSINGQDYSVNDEFRHIARAVSISLDLEEVEAGKLLIQGYGNNLSEDRSLIADTVSSFHDRRDLILQVIRITLQESLNLDHDEGLRDNLQEAVAQILDIRSGPPSNGSLFAAKCFRAMDDIEKWHDKLSDRLQSKEVLGEPRGLEFYATLEFQRESLFKQHEALGCIAAFLFRGNYTVSEDLRKLDQAAKKWEKIGFQQIHYMPAFSAAFRQYGTPDGSVSKETSKSIDGFFREDKADTHSSTIRPFMATLNLWWNAEFSGWFRDSVEDDPLTGSRATATEKALNDGSLEFLLAICTSMTFDGWRHPARQELVALLLTDSGGLNFDGELTSEYFRVMYMECLEGFAEAWITNMPDTIRRLKNDEDDQRLLYLTAMQDGMTPNNMPELVGRLHLESFLLLMSFVFEKRPVAAEQWWEDPDSNLYGFLQWSSRRQTVPRVSAFCEMLCSISEGVDCAAAAHKFLLDESISLPTQRGRRMPSMNYQQIFAEIDLYAHKVHERTPGTQIRNVRKVLPTDMNELESPIMLACYLRLITHLCNHSLATRDYIFSLTTLDFPRTLLLLSSGPVPPYLRASVFATLEALLTDKNWHIGSTMWRTIDDWVSNGHDLVHSNLAKTNQSPLSTADALRNTFNSLSGSYDQYNAFIGLLRSLFTMPPGSISEEQMLPFPIDLGSSYRTPGVGPYVDFICGQIFVTRLRDLGDDAQAVLCSFRCLDLVAGGLESLNENYVAMMNKSMDQREGIRETPIALLYTQRHPFARLMQWLLSDSMNKTMMQKLHVPFDTLEAVSSDSPTVLNLQRCIDIISLTMDLQPTYFDVVRPLIPDQGHDIAKFGASIFSIEESIGAHPELLLSLCQYTVSDHLGLVLRSLMLLQKLSGSSKLNNHFLKAQYSKTNSRRIVDMLGPTGEVDLSHIAGKLASKLAFDIRELEDGFESPNYQIKDGILSFINACIESQPEAPNIAHLLLGFGRVNERLVISTGIDNGISLFNAVLDLVQSYPDSENGIMISWLIHLKSAAMHTLRQLWSAHASAELVVGQFRRLQFLQNSFTDQVIITQGTLWDGKQIQDPPYWFETSAEALAEFLLIRAALYDYVVSDLRAAAKEGLNTLLRQTLSTLQGKSVSSDGTSLTHSNVFDLFDFLELDLSPNLAVPELVFFTDIDPDSYMTSTEDDNPGLYEIGILREVLLKRQSKLLDHQQQQPQTHNATIIDDEEVTTEADNIISVLEARNRCILTRKAQADALHSYVEMIIAIIECCSMDPVKKNQFIFHMMQLLLPKLDAFMLEESTYTSELARAADILLFSLSQTTQDSDHAGNLFAERLFQLFRTCIEGIPMSNSSIALRTVLYSICSQYLARVTDAAIGASDTGRKARSYCMDCVRSASSRLISTILDDAEDGVDTCRLNALNLLASLTSLGRTQKSSFIVESLVKSNGIEILVEPLKSVATEFQDAEPAQRPQLLSIFEARMLLLLQISRTRDGAGAIIEAGLLPAIRDSMLFRVDPDLGIALDNAADSTSSENSAIAALHNYYILISSTLRVVLSTFISRGAQNEQVQYLARTFLQDYRPNLVGLFKKYTGLSGKVDEKSQAVLAECVRSYTGLVSFCGFVDFENFSALEDLGSGMGFT